MTSFSVDGTMFAFYVWEERKRQRDIREAKDTWKVTSVKAG